jgi:DNA helicase-2/ATP-dependent DNA helicase PcrA
VSAVQPEQTARPDPLARLLNPPQLEAVTHAEGPLLILAGAGSGKTRVLTHRIAWLVREKRAYPGEILAVTFTNKAAGELKERIEKLVGPEAERLWVSTFHAFGARVLRRECEALGLARAFAIYDDADQLAECKRACQDLGLEPSNAKAYLARIDGWKNQGLLWSEVKPAQFDVPGHTAQRVYERYQRALQAASAVDFGDLIVRVLELFRSRPEVLERYAGRFRYLLVDEFQDTNPAQYQLLRQLASGHGNLCVVGDDDQSIYRWRGAEVENILDFARHFPGTRVVKLEQNYRSSGNILAAAHAVIAKNERRAAKKLWTAAGAGEKLRVVLAEDERDEGRRIADELYAENARGTAYAEMAVFYRANAQSRVLEDALRARRIPYRVVRGRSFYDRAEVKDVAAYLRLCVNPRSDNDLLRIINTPPRGIGDTTVEHLRAAAARTGLSLWETLRDMDGDARLPANARAKLLPFRALLERLGSAVRGQAGAADAIALVLEQTGYEDRLRLEGEEGEDRIENLHELLGAARDFDAAWNEARAELALAGQPRSSADPVSPLAGAAEAAEEPAPAGPPRAPAPGALGSTEGDGAPGDRPDVRAAVAAAAPELDDDGGGADTPLLGFLEQLALVGDADAAGGGDRAALMTLHAAKGLEFDAVWLTGLEERVFPGTRALGLNAGGSGDEDPEQLAEERRLCYVGMTRARRRLTLTLARCRSLFGELRFNAPSRFLREIPPALTSGLPSIDSSAPAARASSWGTGSSWPRGAASAQRAAASDDFDQRPRYGDDDGPGFGARKPGPQMPPRNAARSFSREDQLSRPKVKELPPGAEGLGPGARVRHPTFGVGTVEDVDGAGTNLKLTVRFAPGVGLKKVLARFVDRA